MDEIKQSEMGKKNLMSKLIKENILIVLLIACSLIIRVVSSLTGIFKIQNPLLLYEESLVEAGETVTIMSSGILHAYCESLHTIFGFTGNRIDIIPIYHIVLQVVAIGLLVVGMQMLFGKVAAYATGILLSISPWMIQNIYVVTPESYYLFFWAIGFFGLTVLYDKTMKNGWYRNNLGEISLVVLGFLLGVICIWHGFGYFLVGIMVYVIVKVWPVQSEKRKLQKDIQAMEKMVGMTENMEKRSDKYEVMPAYSQAIVMLLGMILGQYCVLMKYTGITGDFLIGQLAWWSGLWKLPEAGKWQGLDVIFPFQHIAILAIGFYAQYAWNKVQKRKAELAFLNEEPIKKQPEKVEEKTETTEKIENVTTVTDEKQVTYIENPLPLPKKHVKKTMDFKLSDENEAVAESSKDDFDKEIKEKDDFDI